MGYIYSRQGSYMTLWGYVPRDARLIETQSGKTFTSFSVRYDRHHNEDGQMVNEYMNCQIWGDNAKFVGDESVGIAKGDTVFVGGKLVPDTYHKEGEPEPEDKWMVVADIVLDMTSIFQVAQMVVDGDFATEQEDDYNPKSTSFSPPSAFEETDEISPFGEEVEASDAELPI